jgi:hypothetical protein
MELKQLSEMIHAQNKAVGWWDDVRPVETFACLFHSELSEAMEGDRKGLMDDHLPQYEMFWVEVADFVIRCLDWLGYHNHDNYDFAVWDVWFNRTQFLAYMHRQVSDSVSNTLDPYYRTTNKPANNIAYAVVACFDYASVEKFDLMKVIIEKVEYNKTRADHKRENRQLPEGKKY